MNFLTILFFHLALLSSTFLFGQDDDSNQDWKALNSYLNGEYTTSISQCQSLLKKQTDGVAKNRTQMILARALMQEKKYKEAIEILSTTQLDAAFLKSGIPGLIGDCMIEQGKYVEALDFYEKAFRAEWNPGSTPRYLFKAYLCAEKLDRFDESQQFIQTILFYFPDYSKQLSIEKHLINDSIPHLELNIPKATQPDELGIGTINGKPVSIDQFVEAYGIAESNAEQQAMQLGESPIPVEENRIWKSFVQEKLRQAEYASLNFQPNDEEFMAYLMATDGFAPQQEFLNSPVFTNENGDFQPDLLLMRINEMKNSESEGDQVAWANTKEYYIKKLTWEKHENFAALSLFASTLEVNQHQKEEQNYNIKYQVEVFQEIPDSTIHFTPNELKQLYESKKHTAAYQTTEDQYELVYIQSTVKPNSKDTSDLIFKMEALKKALQKAKDDSAFIVNIKSNLLKFYTSGPYSTAVPVGHKQSEYGRYITFPAELSSTFEAANIGDVVGPYEFNGDLMIAKVIGRTDETIEARHILLDLDVKQEGAQEEAEAFLKTVTNKNFAELAVNYSQDTGSSVKGGILGTFFFGDMVPPFATYCTDAPIGEIGLVLTQFGYHIVQVTKRSGQKFPRLAIVQIPLEISDESTQVAKANLKEIRESYLSNRTDQSIQQSKLLFSSLAEKKDEFVRSSKVITNEPRIIAIDSPALLDSLLKFSFDARTKEGDISEIYVAGKQMILAVLLQKSKAGQKDFESAENQLIADFTKNKKAEILLDRMKKQNTSDSERLTEISYTSLANPKLSGEFEPSVVGQVIRAYNNGQNGIYLKGNAGVYFLQVLIKEDPMFPTGFEEQRIQLNEKQQEQFRSGFEKHLVWSNVIIDNRDLFRLGIRK